MVSVPGLAVPVPVAIAIIISVFGLAVPVPVAIAIMVSVSGLAVPVPVAIAITVSIPVLADPLAVVPLIAITRESPLPLSWLAAERLGSKLGTPHQSAVGPPQLHTFTRHVLKLNTHTVKPRHTATL